MLLTVVHCRQDVGQRPPLRESKPKHGQPQKRNEVRNQVFPHSFHSHLMFSLSSLTFKFLMKSVSNIALATTKQCILSQTYTNTNLELFVSQKNIGCGRKMYYSTARDVILTISVWHAFPTAIAGYLLTVQGMSTNEKHTQNKKTDNF